MLLHAGELVSPLLTPTGALRCPLVQLANATSHLKGSQFLPTTPHSGWVSLLALREKSRLPQFHHFRNGSEGGDQVLLQGPHESYTGREHCGQSSPWHRQLGQLSDPEQVRDQTRGMQRGLWLFLVPRTHVPTVKRNVDIGEGSIDKAERLCYTLWELC